MLSRDYIGKGEFSYVYVIENIQLLPKSSSNNDDVICSSTLEEEEPSRNYMKSHVKRQQEYRYAIKRFNPDVYNKSLLTPKMRACKMLQVETELLTKFSSQHQHPCIINLRGIANLDPMNIGYFLILDKLQCTLRQKIYEDWLPRQAQLGLRKYFLFTQTAHLKKIFFPKRYRKTKLKRYDLLIERLLALVDLASAIKFLHSHRVIYRDLKPENVGFDIRGDLKLFDFGLSRELPMDTCANENGLFKMTGRTGSRRYMSPETTLGYPYNLSSDVYAFGILAWEVFSLTKPFENMSVRQHEILVASGGMRPDIKQNHSFDDRNGELKEFLYRRNLLKSRLNIDNPKSGQNVIDLRKFLCDCWDTDNLKRPTADEAWNVMNTMLTMVLAKGNNMIKEMSIPMHDCNLSRDDILLERSNLSDRVNGHT